MKIHHILFITATALMAACSQAPDPDAEVYSELRSVDKLTLASMTISKMATVDDMRPNDARGIRQTADALLSSFKIGDRVAAYSYNTYMKAYIDMADLRPDDVHVDEAARRITVTLPPIITELAGRDPGFREEHYRVTGLRSSIDADERARIKERMNSQLKAEVEASPAFRAMIVERAQAKARQYFASLLARDGYTVVINFSKSPQP